MHVIQYVHCMKYSWLRYKLYNLYYKLYNTISSIWLLQKATQSDTRFGENQKMAICPQQTAFHSLVRPSPQHYQHQMRLVEVNNNGIVDVNGSASESGATAPVGSVLDAHLVPSAIGHNQYPIFSLPTAQYPFPQYHSLYTHAQWADPRQLQQFQFQPLEPSVPLNQLQAADRRAMTLQAPNASVADSESGGAVPLASGARQYATQPPATMVIFCYRTSCVQLTIQYCT